MPVGVKCGCVYQVRTVHCMSRSTAVEPDAVLPGRAGSVSVGSMLVWKPGPMQTWVHCMRGGLLPRTV
jgi:hypothetical protein